MKILSLEVWLICLIYCLFLYDSLILLREDEVLMVWLGGDRWTMKVGLRDWTLGGRVPYLPNVFKPWTIIYKYRISTTVLEEVGYETEKVPIQLFRALTLPVLFGSILVFLLFPAALVFTGGPIVSLSLLLAFYLNYAFVFLKIDRAREAFRQSRKSLAMIALECLTCPPFAANVTRRLTLRDPRCSFVRDAVVRFSSIELLKTALGFDALIKNALEAYDEDNIHVRSLRSIRDAIYVAAT